MKTKEIVQTSAIIIGLAVAYVGMFIIEAGR